MNDFLNLLKTGSLYSKNGRGYPAPSFTRRPGKARCFMPVNDLATLLFDDEGDDELDKNETLRHIRAFREWLEREMARKNTD